MHFIVFGALRYGSTGEVRPTSLRPIVVPQLVEVVLAGNDDGGKIVRHYPVEVSLSNDSIAEQGRAVGVRRILICGDTGRYNDATYIFGVWLHRFTAEPLISIIDVICAPKYAAPSLSPESDRLTVVAPENISRNPRLSLKVGLDDSGNNNWSLFLGEIAAQSAHLIFQRGCLFPSYVKLFLGCNTSLSRVASSLAGGYSKNVGLAVHFPELIPEHYGRPYDDNQRSDSYNEAPSCVAKSRVLKNSKFILPYFPCEQRVVDDPYWRWARVFGLCVGPWILGWWGCDVLLRDGRFGKKFDSVLWGYWRRSLTDRERLLIRCFGFVAAVVLLVQAFVIVTQKYLTPTRLCNTVSLMANVLSAEKQTAIIAALAAGSSIRSIERITGVHRDTKTGGGKRRSKGGRVW